MTYTTHVNVNTDANNTLRQWSRMDGKQEARACLWHKYRTTVLVLDYELYGVFLGRQNLSCERDISTGRRANAQTIHFHHTSAYVIYLPCMIHTRKTANNSLDYCYRTIILIHMQVSDETKSSSFGALVAYACDLE